MKIYKNLKNSIRYIFCKKLIELDSRKNEKIKNGNIKNNIKNNKKNNKKNKKIKI